MSDCKVMIKAPMKEAKARFSDYEDMEFERRGDWTLVEDYSGTQLFGWKVSSWVELAGQDELIYAYYDEDMNAEFVHVKDGVCLRAYMQYDGGVLLPAPHSGGDAAGRFERAGRCPSALRSCCGRARDR